MLVKDPFFSYVPTKRFILKTGETFAAFPLQILTRDNVLYPSNVAFILPQQFHFFPESVAHVSACK